MELGDPPLPRPVRLLIGAVGAVTSVISLLLFVQPAVLISVWPWKLTPLTTRMMGAMYVLPRVVGLGVARDPRWSAARLILQSQAFSIALILIAALRAWP